MPNEFNIKNGFITSGNSFVFANLQVSGTTIVTPPTDTSAIVSTGYSVTTSGTTPMLRFSGSVNTSGNVIPYIFDVANIASGSGSFLVLFRRNGSYVWGIGLNDGLIYSTSHVSITGAWQIFARENAINGVGIRSSNPSTHTSSNRNHLFIQESFIPTGGTGTYTSILSNPTIGQTGGANGITRGLYVNPIISAATDWRAIETTVGNVMLNTSSGNTLIGTTTNSGFKLDVNGTARIQSGLTATTISASGTKGTVTISGGTTTAFIDVTGSNTVGGTGYTDFIRVTNTAAGATTPTKTLRVNNIGGLEIMNNAYTAVALSITDNGILNVGGGNTATTTSSDGTSNYLSFNANNSQIYDDGNLHIHSRAVNQSMWINTNGGQLNLLTQSPTSTGGIGSGIAIATGTLNGYVTINTGRTVTTAANYGYLTTAGAGTYPGGSQSVVISLYANNRIWGQEIDAFSDERMKNIEGKISLEDGIKLVKNLIPIKYTWKEGDDKGVKAGYSAQQVIKSGFDHLIGLIPTEGLEETIDEDGFLSPKDTQFAMNYDQVTPYHGVVIKHLLEEIEKLKQEIEILKNK